MNKKLVLLSAFLLMGAGTMMAQKHVTGHVVDADGQPVIGATVRVPGTKIVTVTDDEGNFTIPSVPASAKRLNVSYIGMQTASVDVAGNVSVVMQEDATNLEEAVVIGYGTGQKLGTVVGSVKKVGGEKVSGKPSINVADALQGQVAGVQILSSTGDVADVSTPTINVRGLGSLSADNTPLIVVDGSPVGGAALALLNSNDIESVTVLKDASATSIYGSRAANGVMYITTKKGRKGDEKAQITISQKFGWAQLANPVGDVMNANQLLQFQLENDIITMDQYKAYKDLGFNTDWQSYMFDKAAPMQTTDLSIRGGSQNTSYYVSASYLKDDGLTYDSGIKRYTLRTNLDSKCNDWFAFGINQSVTYAERRLEGYSSVATANSYSPSTSALLFAPYWSPYYHPEELADDPTTQYPYYYLSGGYIDTKYVYDLLARDSYNLIYQGTGFITLTPVKGLTIKSQLALYATDTKSNSGYRPDALGLLNANSGDKAASHSRSSMWTITNTAEYKFNIGEDHNFALLLGHEGIKASSEGFSASVQGITDDRFFLLGQGIDPQMPSESYSKYEYLSFFGRIDYTLKNRYSFNFTVRDDASSRFGKTNRSAIFLSGGVMWNAKLEDFFRDIEWMDDLRFRFSVGTTGNSEIGNYAHIGLIGMTYYGGNNSRTPGWGYAQVANTELGWEKQIQTNVGFNVSFLNKFHLDFNWYSRKTKNMLLGTPVPYTTGFSSQMRNIGEMTNRGIEIELNVDAIQKKDAYLGFRFTYGYNMNRIDKLFYGMEEWPMYASLLNYKVGKGLTYYMPIYAGVDKEDGAPMWYKVGYTGKAGHEFNPETMTKNDILIDELYQDTGKKYIPPHTGGFGFTAMWKGLTLNADFSFVLGKWMVDNGYWFLTSNNNAILGVNQHVDMLDIWKKPGDLAKLPGFSYTQQFDTHLLNNASFMRLKNLTLSYDLPKQWMEATGFISNVRLNFQARNVFTITKFSGPDPEIDSNITVGAYPATRQFTVGLEVTF